MPRPAAPLRAAVRELRGANLNWTTTWVGGTIALHVHPLIDQYRTEIEDLCRRFRVKRLELFGSAARGDFDLQRSDIDFLVEFEEFAPGQAADTYLGLLHGMEDLLGRRIDLVMTRAIQNPYFFEAIASDRTLLYAA